MGEAWAASLGGEPGHLTADLLEEVFPVNGVERVEEVKLSETS